MIYIFYDGDNIGKKFAQAYRTGDVGELKNLSTTLNNIHTSIRFAVEKKGGRMIEYGGDEGLIEISVDVVEVMNRIDQIWTQFGLKVSIGAGIEIPTAYNECEKLKSQKASA